MQELTTREVEQVAGGIFTFATFTKMLNNLFSRFSTYTTLPIKLFKGN